MILNVEMEKGKIIQTCLMLIVFKLIKSRSQVIEYPKQQQLNSVVK